MVRAALDGSFIAGDRGDRHEMRVATHSLSLARGEVAPPSSVAPRRTFLCNFT